MDEGTSQASEVASSTPEISEKQRPPESFKEALARADKAASKVGISDNVDIKKMPPAKGAKPPQQVLPPPPPQKQVVKFKSKIGDLEEEVELDEDEIRQQYQIWKGGDLAFKRAAERDSAADQKEKRIQAFINKMQTEDGVLEVIEALGHNSVELAEKRLANHLKYQLMSPAEKQNWELQRQLQQMKQNEALTKQQQEQKEAEAKAKIDAEETARLGGELQKEIIEVMEAGQLPKTPKAIRLVCDHLKRFWERKIDAHPADVIPYVLKDLSDLSAEVLSKMPIKKLKEVLGPEAVKALMRDSLNDVQNPIGKKRQPKQSADMFKRRDPDRSYISEKQFGNYMEKIRKSNI